MAEYLQSDSSSFKIDLSYLEDIAGGSNEFIIEMIDMFLEQTPAYCLEIKQGIQDKDWKKVSDLAHKIKPTLAFMGSHAAKDTMATIEMDARNLANLETIGDTFDKVHLVCLQLFVDLKNARGNFLLVN